MRYPLFGTYRDGNGKVVLGGTISVYLAGTSTPGKIYTASAGGVAVNSATSSTTDGSFSLWADDLDYSASQLFDIVFSMTNYTTRSYASYPIFGNVAQLDSVTTVLADYVIATNRKTILGNGTINVTLPAATTNYQCWVANVGTGDVTILPVGSDTIDGATKYILSNQYESVHLRTDGVSLWVVF